MTSSFLSTPLCTSLRGYWESKRLVRGTLVRNVTVVTGYSIRVTPVGRWQEGGNRALTMGFQDPVHFAPCNLGEKVGVWRVTAGCLDAREGLQARSLAR